MYADVCVRECAEGRAFQVLPRVACGGVSSMIFVNMTKLDETPAKWRYQELIITNSGNTYSVDTISVDETTNDYKPTRRAVKHEYKLHDQGPSFIVFETRERQPATRSASQ